MGSEKKKEKELSEFDRLFIEYAQKETERKEAINILNELISTHGLNGTMREFLIKKIEEIEQEQLREQPIDQIKLFSAIIGEDYIEKSNRDSFSFIKGLMEKAGINKEKANELNLKDNLWILIEGGADFWLKQKDKELESLSKERDVSSEIAAIREYAEEHDISLRKIRDFNTKLDLLQRKGYMSEAKKELLLVRSRMDKLRRKRLPQFPFDSFEKVRELLKKAEKSPEDIGTTKEELESYKSDV